MNYSRSTEIKVGLVSLAGLIILLLGISLGKNLTDSATATKIKFRFPSSSGIKAASPIVVNGVTRGKVTSVSNHQGGVIINAFIDDPKLLRSDATARISILEITGGKKIDVYTGSSESYFDVNNEIQGYNTADLSDLVVLLGDVSGDAVKIIRRLDTTLYVVNTILNDQQFTSDIKETISGTKDLVNNANQLIEHNKSDINFTIAKLKELSIDIQKAINNNEPKLAELLDELKITLKKADGMLVSTDSLVISANAAISNIDQVVSDIRKGNGTVGKLIYDPKLAIEIDSAMVRLSQLVNFIQQHGVNVNVRLGTRP